MIIENISEQLEKLYARYPKLTVMGSTETSVQLSGNIDVYCTARGFTVDKTYSIEVNIPFTTDQLPTVTDIGGNIDPGYVHRYTNGELCLETDTAVRFRFVDGFDIVAWMEEYVEQYFFSYEYFLRFGEFPFGERPHGCNGILDTYRDRWNCKSADETVALFLYAVKGKYRGHDQCPCRSGKRVRNCHGNDLFQLISDERYHKIVLDDLKKIETEYMKYEKTRKNPSTAK